MLKHFLAATFLTLCSASAQAAVDLPAQVVTAVRLLTVPAQNGPEEVLAAIAGSSVPNNGSVMIFRGVDPDWVIGKLSASSAVMHYSGQLATQDGLPASFSLESPTRILKAAVTPQVQVDGIRLAYDLTLDRLDTDASRSRFAMRDAVNVRSGDTVAMVSWAQGKAMVTLLTPKRY